jgi:hypothetical protein
MVKMGMSQKDGVYTVRRHREWVPVSCSELPFLVKTAIYKKAAAVGLQEMARTGDILSGTEKLQLYLHISPQKTTTYL